MPFLIDGHNVIAALPDVDLEDPHDEAKLVLKLRAWTGRVRRKAVVIFDGGVPGGYAHALSTPGVQVIFAARHYTDADRIIRARLKRLPDPANWTVVSSDQEVLERAQREGARTMRAQHFAERLNQKPDLWKEKPDTLSAAEVAYWLEIFGDVAAVAAPPAPKTPSPPAEPPAPHPADAPRAPAPPSPARGHTERSIGAQVGQEPKPARQEPPAPASGKPTAISPEEVEEWLEVFHDDPESHVPPPKPRPQRRKRKAPPKVDKTTAGLSEDEVETWLEVFGGEPEAGSKQEGAERGTLARHRRRSAQSVPTPPNADEAPQPPKKRRRRRNVLGKHKRRYAPAEGEEEAADLSPEDAALWKRMFGEGDG